MKHLCETFFFLFGAHYLYLGQYGKQILFWITLGGFGVWGLVDLFSISSKVDRINTKKELKEIRTATLSNSVNNQNK